ncbi:hypothetical protein DY245_29125 [Streptomyces inhibens]|uniref:Uncharacterized protein n=1 Tax=Streptomyces inhibens TaxID=2293571 RepID=A0A371PWZ4_STRIH|nr:hypothetical protein [Streptomyces inhibens]REK86989.1 hypothetical protein DY245_29125 [Streptomyces inhibens]
MSVGDEPRVYEIRIHGCAGTEEALALQESIVRVLCPDEWHKGPCEVPWGFTLGADERADGGESDGGESVVLVLGIYTSGRTAAEVADRVRAVVGEAREAVLCEGDAEQFEELVEQFRIENGSARS